MPKVSAVMGLYNTPYELLKATLESILSQTFADFELLIIDDASDVLYKDFLKEFSDERIKYFKLEKNSGPGAARNFGIKKAQGEYVAIVDSDDIYMPNRFYTQSAYLDHNRDISLISCSHKQSSNGKVSKVIGDYEDIKAAMLFNSQLANPAVMFRKDEFISKNLFYPEDKIFAEDYQLWVQAMFAGIKMINQRDVLMIYTRRKNQLSRTKTDSQTNILKSIYSQIFSKLGFEATQKELDLHYDIYRENFENHSFQEVSEWFDKIVQHNKKTQIFDENKLIDKKNQKIEKLVKIKNCIFKLKIGRKNLCIYKPFKLVLEKRD